MTRRAAGAKALKWIALALAAVLMVALFLRAVDSLGREQAAQGKTQLEDALRRACVACYAAQGSYPASVEELKERYGVQVDDSRFLVHYDVFASNLMPEIIVLEREP